MIRNHIVYSDFSNYQFTLAKAEGNYLWDTDGRKLLDFTSGWNVTNLGWNHPEVNEAVAVQAKKNVYAPMWSADRIQEEYATELVSSLPKGLDAVCRATGGTEANEEALKIARAVTGRKTIVGFRDTYHGQSFGSIALGTRPEWATDIAPLVPDIMQIPYPSMYRETRPEREVLAEFLTKLEDVLRKKTIAGLFTEAGIITGWGTTDIAPKGYLTAVRKLTEQYGTMLILDEVGTGFSRCGTLFGMELEGVTPDIVTFAKGISNGAAPIGACITRSDLLTPVIGKSKLVSTFGWTPSSCAAGLATLRIHKRDRVWERAATNGSYLLPMLQKQLRKSAHVGDIYGKGLEIAVRFVTPDEGKIDDSFAFKVRDAAYALGLHLVWGGDGNIQVMPPLTMEKKLLDEGVSLFAHAVAKAETA
jgi:putrescine aminotransferase